jgi:hypothetical protein
LVAAEDLPPIGLGRRTTARPIPPSAGDQRDGPGSPSRDVDLAEAATWCTRVYDVAEGPLRSNLARASSRVAGGLGPCVLANCSCSPVVEATERLGFTAMTSVLNPLAC